MCCKERLGFFQVPERWERRWVTGLMNSDGQQLLINQETVCEAAAWNSGPSPKCTHKYILIHIHNPIQLRQDRTSQYTPPSSSSPGPAADARPNSTLVCAYYPCVRTIPTGARPSLNMETPATCKYWKRPREQKLQKMMVKAEPAEEFIFTFIRLLNVLSQVVSDFL